MSLFRAVAILIVAVVLATNIRLIMPLEHWFVGQFHGAVQNERSHHLPNFVLKPGQKPTENTTATYNSPGGSGLSLGGEAKTGKPAPEKQPSLGLGISIDNSAG
jgi:hypothetical protein